MRAETRDSFPAVKVTEHVYWVGAIDWGLRDFHGYGTPRGTTYNSYLVVADKVTLIDTVKAPFWGESLSRIASVVDPSTVAYVVANHAEMDHSGSLPMAMAELGPEQVLASALGVKALRNHFHALGDVTAVKEGESLDLGGLTLSFAEMRMLHWPDSMASYLPEEGVLFSNDAFGMHLASGERFDDELDERVLEEEAARYYANILMPLAGLIPKAIEKVSKLGAIEVIAPSHGPIWRKDWKGIVGRYAAWASGKRTRKVVVVYDTMWQSTAAMARAVAEGVTAAGATVKLMPLRACSRADVATELLEAGALVVGSPTLNNGMFPTVADVLTYCKGLKPKGLIGAAFGSHGWSGEAVGQIEEALEGMKVELVGEGVRVVYAPDGESLRACFSLGKLVAGKLSEGSGG